jgi:hypothetical protein
MTGEFRCLRIIYHRILKKRFRDGLLIYLCAGETPLSDSASAIRIRHAPADTITLVEVLGAHAGP